MFMLFCKGVFGGWNMKKINYQQIKQQVIIKQK